MHLIAIPFLQRLPGIINLQRFGLHCVIKENTRLDVRWIDHEIERASPEPEYTIYRSTNKNKIAYLATELYDMGGHTKCLRDLVGAMANTYEQYIYLCREESTYQYAPLALREMSDHSSILGENMPRIFYENRLSDCFIKLL